MGLGVTWSVLPLKTSCALCDDHSETQKLGNNMRVLFLGLKINPFGLRCFGRAVVTSGNTWTNCVEPVVQSICTEIKKTSAFDGWTVTHRRVNWLTACSLYKSENFLVVEPEWSVTLSSFESPAVGYVVAKHCTSCRAA